MDIKKIGMNIRAERRRQEISQEKLGEMVNLSTNSINMIEKGKQIPNAVNLYLIAKALNTNINNLYQGIE